MEDEGKDNDQGNNEEAWLPTSKPMHNNQLARQHQAAFDEHLNQERFSIFGDDNDGEHAHGYGHGQGHGHRDVSFAPGSIQQQDAYGGGADI
jgi:hypothetical protein